MRFCGARPSFSGIPAPPFLTATGLYWPRPSMRSRQGRAEPSTSFVAGGRASLRNINQIMLRSKSRFDPT